MSAGAARRRGGSTDLPPAAVLDFACERVDLAWQLAQELAPALASEQLDGVYRDLEQPLVPVLAEIERAGIKVDCGVLGRLSERLERELAGATAKIFDLAGESFNINSPRQLAEVLFDRLKLPAGKKTGKTGAASTASAVLEELALVHDVPRLVLEWRSVQKLKGTYVDALPQLVNPATGRVHTSFNQAVAATGRLSSSDPNLQNIPIRTELGREIRAAFVAEPGCVLISADYSQIELRVLAHLSGDAALIEAFRRGDDIHDQTALKVFGADSGLDPHELRRRAKIINYALLYGKTAFTLAKDIGVSQSSAQAFIDAYFAGFPEVRRFIDTLLAEARQTGAVKTLFGRRRLVPELTSPNAQVRAGGGAGVGEHADPGHRGGHPEARDDRRRPGARRPARARRACPDDSDRPRRTAVRDASRRGGRGGAAGAGKDGKRRTALRPAHGRRGDWGELEGSEGMISWQLAAGSWQRNTTIAPWQPTIR